MRFKASDVTVICDKRLPKDSATIRQEQKNYIRITGDNSAFAQAMDKEFEALRLKALAEVDELNAQMWRDGTKENTE